MTGQYDDIIGLPHHVSSTRPQMSLSDRAAQFAPFAALTGYDAAVKETARLTSSRIDLDDYAKESLNEKLLLIEERIESNPQIIITYFMPDDRKSGGAYVSVTGTVKKIDDYEHVVVMRDGKKIPINEIAIIEGDLFAELE